MRITTYITLFGAAAIAAVAGCTVKDIDQPPLAGPSTFAHSIIMVADRHTLIQNGVDFTDIRITSLGPDGQSESIPLRAQVFVDGIAQDFGTLSTKSPVTPTTIRFTTPPASTLVAGQVPTTVTIAVTPSGTGDFRSEFSRQIDIRLEPQGVILPVNPNLVPKFTFTPASPLAAQTVTFDASTTTNNGSPCAQACTYAWNFGDGTTGAGITANHVFKPANNYAVTLTVTDSRGASAQLTQSVPVGAPTPPTAVFKFSPTPPSLNVDMFFNASESTPAAGRTIVSYTWDFGDGSGASGVTVSHRYTGAGTYTVVLTVKDDADATARTTQTLSLGVATPNPVASITATPSGGKAPIRISFDASASTPSTGSTIVSYKFDYGDGTQETVTNPVQSHTFSAAGTFVVSVEVTDSNGKTATKTVAVTIT